MQSLEALSARLHTTGEIHAIVRTMKALSAARIHQFDGAVEAIGGFEHTIEMGLRIVLRGKDVTAWPRPEGGGSGLIVIGSDRGLCGRFNDRITRFACDRIRTATKAAPRRLCVLGQRAAAKMDLAGHPPDTTFGLPGAVGGLADTVRAVALEIDRWTHEAGVGRVAILFNRRAGSDLSEPHARQVLPVPADYLEALAQARWPSRSLPTYRMEATRLFSWLIGQRIFVLLYRALAESLASEHAARLASMQRAERNIGGHREELMDAYRQLRQEAITRELLDILAGFEAAGQGLDADGAPLPDERSRAI